MDKRAMKIKRILYLGGIIIDGSFKRDLERIFPETLGLFEQRKSYDEYYCPTNIEVEFDMLKINDITSQYHYKVIINYEDIYIGD